MVLLINMIKEIAVSTDFFYRPYISSQIINLNFNNLQEIRIFNTIVYYFLKQKKKGLYYIISHNYVITPFYL